MSEEIKKTMKSVDGNTASALASYNFTEVASIFPITPSSTMAELVDQYASEGMKNCFGQLVKVIEMQSEAGASGTVHGALQAGSLATTYTASQGLLLMIPNIYKWVGEFLPAVLHVSARALATRSLSIFGDHQDIYAIRQTGITMLCAHSVQEVADLASLAHLIAIKSHVPVCHFFDGFRTSHEIQNVEFIDPADWAKLVDQEALESFRQRALNPHTHAVTRGGAENDDIYFQGREAQNVHFNKVIGIAEEYFEKVTAMTGRKYAPFVYYGAEDAERVIVAMGSVTETALEVVDALNKAGEKVGLVKVHLYRPFSAKHLVSVLPETVKKIAVLDRTKETGALGEPLYLDVVAALEQMNRKVDVVIGGRYGLSSKDTQPKHIKAVYDFLNAEKVWTGFTVGINDDVTHLSIPVDEDFHVDGNYTSCLFYGLGSDGTVSANKSSIKIIGDATHQYAQAYFAYDSRKAGGVTRSHLRFGKEPIHSTYYVEHADFLSCSLDSYIFKFDMIKCLKKGGTFLLNTDIPADQIEARLPNRMKRQLAKKNAKFYIIDANAIAARIGLGRRTNTILQSAFFYLNQNIMPYADAQQWMKNFAKKAYGKKGDDIVNMNYAAIDAGSEGLIEVVVKPEWADLDATRVYATTGDEYFDSFVNVIGSLDGYDLPVSKFTEYELLDGTMRNDVTFMEKRSIADRVPMWIKENCIQCNQCAFVCPHATIRPFLLDENEVKGLPENVRGDVATAIGGPAVKGLSFRIQVSPRNCVGCGLCVVECPGKKGEKALVMVEAKSQFEVQEPAADYLYKHVTYKTGGFNVTSVKGASFLMPYAEVSGACAGCGETPYYRLVSQLFGKDMLVANATGCSSIYNGSTPLTPFCTDKDGNGIAWANSLFEDNAEYGFGMRIATDYKLGQICQILEANKANVEPELQAAIEQYEANIKNREVAREIIPNLVSLIKASSNEAIKEVLAYERDLLDKSVWIVGGDGWAYDIGYGGLDHVIANEEDVNILVLDTEVYSNTGGQSSKSSQTGSIAKFTASGKKTAKKNLAMMAISYGNVYVAQISMGANKMQAIKALKEAESYNGPSLIICYSPCQAHGLKGGLANAQKTEKEAVACGYFPIFRYDPRLEAEGKCPMQIDCAEPDFTKFRDFVMTQTRYSQLPKVNPEHAEELLTKSQEYAALRWKRFKRLCD